MVEQVEQDGAGNVVRQIAHDAQFGCAQGVRQGGEIDFEDIAFHHIQALAATQAGGQVAVQLNHGQLPQALKQGLGQGHQAGANFHHGLARLRCNGAHDVVNDGPIDQKILAKALAGDVLGLAHRPRSSVLRYST